MSEFETAVEQPETETAEAPPRSPAPPIESRFLFVDVAALRAKQLRRGARSRLEPAEPEAAPAAVLTPPVAPPTPAPRKFKPERVAMQEVRHGLVDWQLPDFKAVFDIR